MENSDDVATPLLPSTTGDEKANDKDEEEDEVESSANLRPFYGVGIHGRASVDEYAQEVGESIQKKKAPLTDLGCGSVPLPAVDDDEPEEEEEEEEEKKKREMEDVREATVVTSTSDDGDGGSDGADKDDSLKDLETEDTVPAAMETSPATVKKVDASLEVGNVEEGVDTMDSPPIMTTTVSAATTEEEDPKTVTERRPSTLRYGGVGLHALRPSDEYVQNIEEAMQRPPPVDLRPPSDNSDKEEEVAEVPEAIVGLLSPNDDGNNSKAKNTVDETEVQPEDENEDEVQTDDEATNATTTVSSAIDRIEDKSLATTQAMSHLATALRYGAVGLHGKTPFDEYAHEIEESIQRGAQVGQGLKSGGVVGVESSEEEGDASPKAVGSERDLEAPVNVHVHDKNHEGATKKPIPPSINTRPSSSVSTLGGATTHTTTSSRNFDHPSSPSSFSSSSDFLDDSYDSSNPSSPSTPSSSSIPHQTAVQKELQDLRHRRRKIQLVDDAQRKKEQLDRIREQLERKTLGKIREQVSFWETKGVLEQKVVGAEEVLEEDDETEGRKVEGDEGDGGEGGGGVTEKYSKKSAPARGLSLSQEHLRGKGSGGKKSSLPSSGGVVGEEEEEEGGGGGGGGGEEPISPGNSQSPGGYYVEMPQLAPRRSLPTTSLSTNDKVPTPLPGSVPSSAPESSEMDAFLSKVD
jgi:hypothetical protein